MLVVLRYWFVFVCWLFFVLRLAILWLIDSYDDTNKVFVKLTTSKAV
jgi:hypothetical protein